MTTPHPLHTATQRLRHRCAAAVGAIATLALLSTTAACSADLSDPQDILGGGRGGVIARSTGAPSCDPPPTRTSLGAASAALGGKEGSNPFLSFITAVGEEAGTFGEDQGLGWLLNVITGGQGDQTQKQIDALTTDVNAKTQALQTQITNVCNLMDSKLDTLETNDTRNSYNTLAGQVDTSTSKINAWWRDYTGVVAELQKGTKVDDLSTDDLRELADMRDNLKDTMQQIADKVLPGSGGGDGMIVVYSHLLSDQAGYAPTKVAQYAGTHIFPADYVNAAYDMSEYYTSQLALGMFLYSEVTHLAFPNVNSEAHPYTVQPTYASDFATVVAGWAKAFDNQVSAGSDHYLTTGIGRIPAGTVLDYRDRSHPRLWSNTPAVLPWDAESTAGYCPTVSTFCYLKTYDGDGALGDLTVARPSWAPVQAMVNANQWGGIDGWRVPTTADWNSVQTGAGADGLTAMAHPTGMTIFDRTKTTLHVHGVDTTVQAIRPTLVNTGSSSAPTYGLLTSTDAKDKTLTSRPLVSDATNAEGGSLFLVQDFIPSTAVPAPTPRLTQPSVPRARPAGHPSKVGLDGPSTFSNETSCQVYSVPVGATAVKVTATGGAGADGVQNGSATAVGGRGGTVTATIPVAAGTKLYVKVGETGSGTNGKTSGGGSAGPADPALFGAKPSSGGAGGGMSGVSSDADCRSFLAVGGGGGGGGAGLTIPESMTGGKGGDSCLVSGSSASTDGTCVTATDGAAHLKVSKGFSPYADSGGKAGGGPGKASGGAAGTAKPYDETTYNQPGNPAGGTAGGAGGGYVSRAASSFGGGGGGGAGFPGGGGGGGGGNIGAGGGGGGGTSFITNGLPTPGSFSLAAKGTAPSVTITPIADPVVLQSTGSGFVANISGGVSTDGAPIIQYPRSGQRNERWLIQAAGDDDAGEFALVNPDTTKCLAASSAAQNSQIQLQTCNGKSAQRWRLTGGTGSAVVVSALDAPGDGQLVLSTDRNAPTVFGASLVLALDTDTPGQRWAINHAGW
ncbi:MAG: RICIN domain-containing protein [Propionibacteriaceae bacterium]